MPTQIIGGQSEPGHLLLKQKESEAKNLTSANDRPVAPIPTRRAVDGSGTGDYDAYFLLVPKLPVTSCAGRLNSLLT